MDELLGDFLTETGEGIAMLDAELVAWEKNPHDEALLDNIFRVMHTIKGSCGFIGLPRLEKLAHAAEDLLGDARSGALKISASHVSLILQTLDQIRDILQELDAHKAEPTGCDESLIKALQDMRVGDLNSAFTRTSKAPVINDAVSGTSAYKGPSLPQTVRVKVEYLEGLMSAISELVLSRNQLLELARSHENSVFTQPLQRLSHVTSALQEEVMKTRMQPIKKAWGKLPRLVRDLAVETKKDVQLNMLGEDTELDRQVIEIIQDPLMHMVRNAIGHGLESPDKRLKSGKKSTGEITLSAYHQGGYVYIEIADDGRGLDIETIKEKSIAMGVATPDALKEMPLDELYMLIMQPGFSTAEDVNSISGRGVGMDVVHKNIERIGGNIALESEAGKGMKVILKIPLTLAIIKTLIVESGGHKFAVPQISVKELVNVSKGAVNKVEYVHDAPVLRLRDQLLPLISLRAVLKAENLDKAGENYIIVSQIGAVMFGVLVDKVLDIEEVVVKPVASVLRDIPVFSGNTLLGDGRVVMILDMNGISDLIPQENSKHFCHKSSEKKPDEVKPETAYITFLIDDSISMAVPLDQVSKLDKINAELIENRTSGQPVVQRDGILLPLVSLSSKGCFPDNGMAPLLVIKHTDQSLGLVVNQLMDVVHTSEKIDQNLQYSKSMGSIVLNGVAMAVLDVHKLFLAQKNRVNT